MFQPLLQSCVLMFKHCLICPAAPQTGFFCTPKRGNQPVLSQYAYEIWLHLLVHLPGNLIFKAAGMKLQHFA
jgi:hypothetical protein